MRAALPAFAARVCVRVLLRARTFLARPATAAPPRRWMRPPAAAAAMCTPRQCCTCMWQAGVRRALVVFESGVRVAGTRLTHAAMQPAMTDGLCIGHLMPGSLSFDSGSCSCVRL